MNTNPVKLTSTITAPYPFVGTREPYLSSRAKSRAAAIRAELDTLRKLDEVIESIIIARLKCPEVFNEFKKEILAFPASKHNDQVDALSQALQRANAPPPPMPVFGRHGSI